MEKLYVFSLFFIATCFCISLTQSEKQYGDECLESEPRSCNIKETLACTNGTCTCADPENMLYSPSRGLCVGLAGKPCVMHQSEAEFVPYRRNQCIMYSQCEDKLCTCWSGFYKDSNGHCVRKKGYMEPCNASLECDDRRAFNCIDTGDQKYCSCSNKTGVYIPSKGRCVGLAGEKCLNSYRECVNRFKCRANKCVCKYKETESEDGNMLCEPMWHRYGKKCGIYNNTCGEDTRNLKCLDGKCRCSNPDYQIYDYNERACVSLVGGPCSVPPVNRSNSKFYSDNFAPIKCIEYARCIKYENYENSLEESGRCECLPDFSETGKGRCSLPYGASCDTRNSKFDKCDKTIPLYCVNGKCGCRNNLDVFEKSINRCKKSVGSLCQSHAECVKNSDCVPRGKDKLAGAGRCMCRPRYRPSSTGSCN